MSKLMHQNTFLKRKHKMSHTCTMT